MTRPGAAQPPARGFHDGSGRRGCVEEIAQCLADGQVVPRAAVVIGVVTAAAEDGVCEQGKG